MRDFLSWNIYLSRIAGVQIRLHASFLLLLVAVIAARQQLPLWYGLSAVAVLFFSVAWHEFAHCLVARKRGGSAEHVLLWPLGGLAPVNVLAHAPQQEIPTALAGLLANLMVCAFTFPILLLNESAGWLNLNPFRLPPPGETLHWQSTVALVFWTNWVLLLANALPAFPFDGARLLRALLWPRLGYRTASLYAVRVAKLTALALLVLGFAVHERYPVALMVLASLSVLLYFAARHEVEKFQDTDSEDREFGYDFSQGYTSLERAASAPQAPRLSLLQRWLSTRRENRRRRQRELEEIEDLRVDDVLARLHETGADGLSPDDRALLKRVSMRYRNRDRA